MAVCSTSLYDCTDSTNFNTNSLCLMLGRERERDRENEGEREKERERERERTITTNFHMITALPCKFIIFFLKAKLFYNY